MGRGNGSMPEFWHEAVRLALTSGRTRKEVAEDLGIGLSSLTRWIGQCRGEQASPDLVTICKASCAGFARRTRCSSSGAKS